MATEQEDELRRVRQTIGPLILQFVRERYARGRYRFRMPRLSDFITKQIGYVARASPDRIFRALRDEGYYRYRVINRAGSEYEILWVLPDGQQPTPKTKTKLFRYYALYQSNGLQRIAGPYTTEAQLDARCATFSARHRPVSRLVVTPTKTLHFVKRKRTP